MPRPRRRSIDSSSSSSDSDDSDGKKLSKQEKKQRKERKMEYNHSQAPLMPEPVHHDSAPGMPQGPQSVPSGFSAPPASGYRIPLRTDAPFPGNQQQVGEPPCRDLDGSPIYFGSALFDKSVHPCKIGPHLNSYCSVPYAGTEVSHTGRYDLLPFDYNTMELVPTSNGHIPHGRHPVEGGYEDHGARLYHAVGLVNGVRIPGKTGTHLGGCNVSFGGEEHVISQNYEILCWK